MMKPPKILLYGPPGAGKTGFVGTAGKHLQLIDLDEGTRTLATMDDKWKEERKLCLAGVLECYEENPKRAIAFNKARSYLDTIFTQCYDGKYAYKVVGIDSLTTLSEYSMRSILANNAMLGKNPQLQHWGARDILLKEILINLKALPVAVVVIAHQHLGKDDDTQYCPAIAGKQLPPLLHSQFDEILHMRVRKAAQGKVEYIIEGTGQADCLVRTRSNFPSPYFADEGFPKLLSLMGYPLEEGEKKGGVDEVNKT